MYIIANHLGALSVALTDTPARSGRSQASIASLLTLSHWGPLGVTEIAAILRLSQPATTRLLNKLKVEGLVELACDGSGRERPMRLTAAGRELASSLQKERLGRIERALAVLDADEAEGFAKALVKMLDGLVEGRSHARHICRLCDHEMCDGPLCPVGMKATELEGAMA
jgi:DNA-binding MarR family transcriptional regulator